MPQTFAGLDEDNRALRQELREMRAENERLRDAYAKMCVVIHEFIGGFDTAETAREKLRACLAGYGRATRPDSSNG